MPPRRTGSAARSASAWTRVCLKQYVEAVPPPHAATEGKAGPRRVDLLTLRDSQLSADQIGQLYELFQASQDVWLTPEELEAKLKAEGRTEEGIPAGQVLPDLGKANRIGGDGDGR